MRKGILLTAAMVLAISACSCSNDSNKSLESGTTTVQDSKSDNSAENKDATEETTTETTTAESMEDVDEALIAELSDVCDRSLNTFYNIVSMFYLPMEDEPVVDNKYPVISTEFTTVEEIKNYVRDIYTDEGLEEVLTKIDVLYSDIDGQLCIDMDQMAARGYLANWDNFKIRNVNVENDTCTFEIVGTTEEPGDVPIIEEYSVEVTAKKVDGRWLLTKMFS